MRKDEGRRMKDEKNIQSSDAIDILLGYQKAAASIK
jgi:hypothetical protein